MSLTKGRIYAQNTKKKTKRERKSGVNLEKKFMKKKIEPWISSVEHDF